MMGNLISLEFKVEPNGLVWVSQNNQVVGVRLPVTSSGTSSTNEFMNTAKQFSLILPASLQIAQQNGDITVLNSESPPAAVILATSQAMPDLEQSVKAVVNQLDPSFVQKPDNIRELPPLNGVVWTQYLYKIPGDQTLVALATKKGDTVFVVIVQVKTADLNAITPTINQLLLSYKILI